MVPITWGELDTTPPTPGDIIFRGRKATTGVWYYPCYQVQGTSNQSLVWYTAVRSTWNQVLVRKRDRYHVSRSQGYAVRRNMTDDIMLMISADEAADNLYDAPSPCPDSPGFFPAPFVARACTPITSAATAVCAVAGAPAAAAAADAAAAAAWPVAWSAACSSAFESTAIDSEGGPRNINRCCGHGTRAVVLVVVRVGIDIAADAAEVVRTREAAWGESSSSRRVPRFRCGCRC